MYTLYNLADLILHFDLGQPCMENQFMCENKQCIPRTYVCNGIFDCDDRSDEHQKCNCNDFII